MKPTYIRAFGIEIMIEPTDYSAFTHTKEEPNVREIQLGKTKVTICHTDVKGFEVDRFTWTVTLP